MTAATCPFCSASMHRREVLAGWCESCGKTLPRLRLAAPRAGGSLWLRALTVVAAVPTGFVLYWLGAMLLH
jgi:hypothetical protein